MLKDSNSMKPMTYSDSGVDYKSADPGKVDAQVAADNTSDNLISHGMKVVPQSRGESAFVWDEGDSYRSVVIEGLGTKNLIADKMFDLTGKIHYGAIAKDCIAMIVNDLVVVGALPNVVNAYFGVGAGSWIAEKPRMDALISGWAKACDESNATWGGGETPMLAGIINDETIDLAGCAVGKIYPKHNLVLGNQLKPGDEIVLLESSGIHSNGITFARKIVENLEDGYQTKLSTGQSIGEALLAPTHLYVKFVAELQRNNIIPSYMVNVTGHGWRKLMRAEKPFEYHFEETMPVQAEFELMQKESGVTDKEMYSTFNMGAGYGVFVSPEFSADVINIAKECGFYAKPCGIVGKEVDESKKKLVIKPKDITFDSDALQVRKK